VGAGSTGLVRDVPLVVAAFQAGGQANGGLASLEVLLAQLARRVVVVTDLESAAVARLREAGREVHVWPSPPLPARRRSPRERADAALAHATYNQRVGDLVRRLGAKVVLANDIRAFWHAALGARLAGAQALFTIRSMFVEGRRPGPRWRLLWHTSPGLLALSREMADEVRALFPPYPRLPGPRARVFVVPSIVARHAAEVPSAEQRRRAAAALGLGAGPVLLHVGRFWDVKQQREVLSRMAPALLSRLPEATLVFVGDFEPARDPYARECERALEALPPELRARVRLEGFSADVGRYYEAASLTLVTSRYEGLARAMIESLSAGTPVASFDVTSAREVLGQGGGVVRRRGDFEGLTEAAVALVSSPEALVAHARAGLETARRSFSAGPNARLFEQVLAVFEGDPAEAVASSRG
jgi:glycosyltransferase involved in cell wall biosynthesis